VAEPARHPPERATETRGLAWQDPALFDTARAAEERDRREAAADARASTRERLEEDRELIFVTL
jgi:hypothetical protein